MILYGAMGMLIALLLSFTDKLLMRVAYGLCALLIVSGIGMGIGAAFIDTSEFDFSGFSAADSYWELLGEQAIMVGAQLMSIPLTGAMVLPVMLVGFV